MRYLHMATMGLVFALAPAFLAAEDAASRWTIARAAAAPAVIENVDALPSSERGAASFKLTIANTSGATLEQVAVIARVFSSSGARKAFFSEWHKLSGLPGDRATVSLTFKPGLVTAGDRVVVTLGQVRYGDARRTWDWRIDQVEAHKLAPGMTATLGGRTTLMPALTLSDPEPDASMCDWCATTAAGLCGYKPNAAGTTCNRPGCVQSFSCKMDAGCEVTCKDDDNCC